MATNIFTLKLNDTEFQSRLKQSAEEVKAYNTQIANSILKVAQLEKDRAKLFEQKAVAQSEGSKQTVSALNREIAVMGSLIRAEKDRTSAVRDAVKASEINTSTLKQSMSAYEAERQAVLASLNAQKQREAAYTKQVYAFKSAMASQKRAEEEATISSLNAQKQREAASRTEYERAYVNTAAQNKYADAISRLKQYKDQGIISTKEFTASEAKLKTQLTESNIPLETQLNHFIRIARWGGTIMGVYYGLNKVWGMTIGQGIELNRVVEDNTYGIAALLAANTSVIASNGQLVDSGQRFQMAISVSTQTLEKLRKASVDTFATFPQLTEIFQQAIGQTLSMGKSFGSTTDEIINNTIQLSQRMSNIAGAIGMPMDRVREEIRSILSGNASTDSLISTLLFGSPSAANEAIRHAKDNGEKGVSELLDRMLKPFDQLKDIDTYSRSLLDFQAQYQALTMRLSAPVKDALKEVIDRITKTIDDKTIDTMGQLFENAFNSWVEWLKIVAEELDILGESIGSIVELGNVLADLVGTTLPDAFQEANKNLSFFDYLILGAGSAVDAIRLLITTITNEMNRSLEVVSKTYNKAMYYKATIDPFSSVGEAAKYKMAAAANELEISKIDKLQYSQVESSVNRAIDRYRALIKNASGKTGATASGGVQLGISEVDLKSIGAAQKEIADAHAKTVAGLNEQKQKYLDIVTAIDSEVKSIKMAKGSDEERTIALKAREEWRKAALGKIKLIDKEIADANKKDTREATQAEGERARIAKQLLENKLAQIDADEKEYFLRNDITGKIEQSRYHLEKTLVAQYEATISAGNYKQKKEDIAKLESKIYGSALELSVLEEKRDRDATTRLSNIQYELKGVGLRVEAEKEQYEYDKKLIDLSDQAVANLKEKGYTEQQVSDIFLAQLETLNAQTSEMKLQKELSLDEDYRKQNVELSKQLKSLSFASDYEKAIADEEERMLEIRLEVAKLLEAHPELLKEQLSLLEKQEQISARTIQQTTLGYKIEMSMMDDLGKLMTDFFDGQINGWDDVKNVATDTLHEIYSEIVKMSVVDPFVNWGKRALTGISLGADLVGTTLSASDIEDLGGTVGQAFTTSGGTAISEAGIVTSSGSDIGTLVNNVSTLKTAYSVLTNGLSTSIADAFASGASSIYGLTGSSTLAGGIGNFGAGFASPFNAGAGSAAGYGAMTSVGLMGGITGYGLGSLGDKLFGADTQAANYGAMGGAAGAMIGSVVPVVGTLVGAVVGSALGSLIGGAFGSTKTTDQGLSFGQTTGSGVGFQDIQSYVDKKKKSWYSSKSWTTLGEITEDERKKIEGIFDAYDYLLAQLGSIEQVSLEAGKYSKDTFQDQLSKNFISTFTGGFDTQIYDQWVEYSKAINKTVLEAMSESINTFIQSTRDFTVWSLERSGGSTEALRQKAQWLQADFSNLEKVMGVTGITVDNFTSQYESAIKSSLDPTTITQWQSLGTMLRSATDAQDAYTKAINDTIAAQQQSALDTVNTLSSAYSALSSKISDILGMIREIDGTKMTFAEAGNDPVKIMQAYRDSMEELNTSYTAQVNELTNSYQAQSEAMKNIAKYANNLVTSAEQLRYQGISDPAQQYDYVYSKLNTLLSGTVTEDTSAKIVNYAGIYAGVAQTKFETRKEYEFAVATMANRVEGLGKSLTEGTTLYDLEESNKTAIDELAHSNSEAIIALKVSTIGKLQEVIDYAKSDQQLLADQLKLLLDGYTIFWGDGSPIISNLKGIISAIQGISLSSIQGISLSRPTEQWDNNVWRSTGGAIATGREGGYDITTKTGTTISDVAARGFVDEMLAKNDPMSVYIGATSIGLSANSLDTMMGWEAGTSNSWAEAQGLPQFAVGTTNVPYDMYAKIHAGEVIMPQTFSDGVRRGELSVGNTSSLEDKLDQQIAKLDIMSKAVIDIRDIQNEALVRLENIEKVS